MSRTYRAIGINLKSMPLGEADRLLTILTREHGLVQAVAMGSRKHNSSLSGRSGLFVVNDLMIAKGRSLDKIAQAETLESYPKLGQDLKKLTASQYLAELVLCQALSDQPQEDLFYWLNEHLRRLERSPADQVLSRLNHGIFHLLLLEGVVPQVHHCCVTRQPLIPDLEDGNWKVGFSMVAGGTVTLEALQQLQKKRQPMKSSVMNEARFGEEKKPNASPWDQAPMVSEIPASKSFQRSQPLHRTITAPELLVLQAIAQAESSLELTAAEPPDFSHLAASVQDWLAVERLLRQYAQYHFDRPIRSASLIDACFLTSPISHPPQL